MEYDGGDVPGVSHECVDVEVELVRGQVTAVLDVAACPVVVAHVHDEVVFPGNLVALDYRCELLRGWGMGTELMD